MSIAASGKGGVGRGIAGGRARRRSAPARRSSAAQTQGQRCPSMSIKLERAQRQARVARVLDRQLDVGQRLARRRRARRPGPIPSWARTIAPASSPARVAANMSAALSPRQSWVSTSSRPGAGPCSAATAAVQAAVSPQGVRQQSGVDAEPAQPLKARGRCRPRPRRGRGRSGGRARRSAGRRVCPSRASGRPAPAVPPARGAIGKKVAAAPASASRSSSRGVSTGIGAVVEGERERWHRVGLYPARRPGRNGSPQPR